MGLLGTIGGILGGDSAASAARQQAEQLRQAGQQAFEASRFRPVGITTAFGTSNFTVDPTTGALTGAGYTADPRLAALQSNLFGQLGGAGTNLSGQGLTAAQGLFNLGQGYLATSPEQAASDWMAKQQAALAPSRERALSGIRQNLFNTGRGGLSVAQGEGMGASNPELQAYYNSLAQQDLNLAGQAQEQGRAATQFGAGLFGLGSNVATAGYNPLKAQLGLLSSSEELAQQPLQLGLNIGNTATAANARAAQLRLNPQTSAAQAEYSANAWNPWSAALGGLDSMFNIGSLFGGGSGGYASSPSYSFNAPLYNTQMAGLGNTGLAGLVW